MNKIVENVGTVHTGNLLDNENKIFRRDIWINASDCCAKKKIKKDKKRVVEDANPYNTNARILENKKKLHK